MQVTITRLDAVYVNLETGTCQRLGVVDQPGEVRGVNIRVGEALVPDSSVCLRLRQAPASWSRIRSILLGSPPGGQGEAPGLKAASKPVSSPARVGSRSALAT